MVDPATVYPSSWYRIEKGTGCWTWLRAKNTHGYGHLKRNGRWHQAHRLMFEEVYGPLPHSYVMDHLCRHRDCINVDHLEPVTNAENLLRGIGKTSRQKLCKRGHDLTARENIYLQRRLRKGVFYTLRDCRLCKRIREKELRRARSGT